MRDHSGLRRETYGPGIPYRSRMERDGWVVKQGTSRSKRILEKTFPQGWVLRRLGWRGGYELENPNEGKLDFPAWEWAEWDRHRLVWADAGRLQAARLGAHKMTAVHTLYDFNNMVPPPHYSTRMNLRSSGCGARPHS